MEEGRQQDGIPDSSPEEEKTERSVFPIAPLLLAPLFLVIASFLKHSHRMAGNVSGLRKVEYGPAFPLFQFAGVALCFYLAYVAFKKGFPGWGWVFGSLAVAFNPFPAFATGIAGDSMAWGVAVLAAVSVTVKALMDSPRQRGKL